MTMFNNAGSVSSKNMIPRIIKHATKRTTAVSMKNSSMMAPLSSKAIAYSSASSSPAYYSSPVVVRDCSSRQIDHYLGNLLEGFCNGSCVTTRR
eukprot:jgi/Psemu1/301777/fgenesh1_kg.44_\